MWNQRISSGRAACAKSKEIGKTRLNALLVQLIEESYDKLLRKGLTKTTVHQAHTVLHNALKKAVQWGLLGVNPAGVATAPRPDRHEMKVLNESQVAALLDFTRRTELHGLWTVLCTTGLRLGEALGLKWEDLDLAEGRLHVRRAVQRQRAAGVVFVEPKTKKSRRIVYFPEGTTEALKDHRMRQLERRLEAGSAWQDQGLLFCRANGLPIDPDSLPAKLHKILADAGLPQVRIHDLRHSAATIHLSHGENPKIVQEMLGHTNIGTTMDLYSHVTPAMHAAVARNMQALFTSGGGRPYTLQSKLLSNTEKAA